MLDLKLEHDEKELVAILTLLQVKGLGPVKFRSIYEQFHSFSRVFDLPSFEIREKLHFPDKIVDGISQQKEKTESIEQTAREQITKARNLNAHLITYSDKEYPPNLYASNHCVPLLYALGNLSVLKNEKCCAVVGTRKPTKWAEQEAKFAVKKLVNDDFTIVSGLAIGIDRIAHSTTLDNSGKTIAVVGCGVDFPYPKQNIDVRERIIQNGVIISEYQFGTKVLVFGLKKRNKIIVGLSKYVLITQTSQKGGTMNAYRAALEQKKPVGIFYPPSNLAKHFNGNLKILRESKIPVFKFTSGDGVDFSRENYAQRLLV
jgi:DNA processing protein